MSISIFLGSCFVYSSVDLWYVKSSGFVADLGCLWDENLEQTEACGENLYQLHTLIHNEVSGVAGVESVVPRFPPLPVTSQEPTDFNLFLLWLVARMLLYPVRNYFTDMPAMSMCTCSRISRDIKLRALVLHHCYRPPSTYLTPQQLLVLIHTLTSSSPIHPSPCYALNHNQSSASAKTARESYRSA